MKITCQSCQAKYTIADEKVLGKIVKIRCKKCASTIVVNGTDPTAVTTTASAPADIPRPLDSSEIPEEGWTVNVAEGDQRQMTDAEVVAAFKAEVIDAETFFWKDGMDDWAALRELAPLYAACIAGVPAPASSPSRLGGAREAAHFPAPASNANGAGAGFATAGQPAARRGVGRAPAADLFGRVARAGGEEDVLTSAPAKLPQAHEDPQKGPIGARNENSVLFSMSAVAGKGQYDPPAPPPSVTDTTEASGLIDIRQLSAQLAIEDKKRSRVEDIMNLSGGGVFLPNLTSASLAAPSIEEWAGGGSSRAPAGRNKAVIFLALGAGSFVIVAAIGVATMLMHREGSAADTSGEKANASVSAAETTAAPVGSVAMAAPVAASTTASAASAAPPPPAPAERSVSPSSDVPKERKTVANAALAAPREAPPPKAALVQADQPFNMGEAKAKLGAAANSAAGCKRANGPTGTGRVVVVFAPSGAPQSATVTGDPFEGTPTGTCVASKFRAVRVPAFTGSPFSVSKSFTIN